MEPTQPIQPAPENKSSIGSIIGTIIIIAIIVLGGLYFWGKRIEESKVKQDLVEDEMSQTQEQGIMMEDGSMEGNNISEVSSSDDLGSIEADLNATNLENLDAELDAELE